MIRRQPVQHCRKTVIWWLNLWWEYLIIWLPYQRKYAMKSMAKWKLSAHKFHLHWWFRERTEWINSESTGYNFIDLARWSNLGAVGNSQLKIGPLSQVFDMRILFLFGRKGFSYLEQLSFQWSEDRGEIGTYTYVAFQVLQLSSSQQPLVSLAKVAEAHNNAGVLLAR